jgi:hypothetical protein
VFGCLVYSDQPRTEEKQKTRQSNTTEKLTSTNISTQFQRTIPRRKVTIKIIIYRDPIYQKIMLKNDAKKRSKNDVKNRSKICSKNRPQKCSKINFIMLAMGGSKNVKNDQFSVRGVRRGHFINFLNFLRFLQKLSSF